MAKDKNFAVMLDNRIKNVMQKAFIFCILYKYNLDYIHIYEILFIYLYKDLNNFKNNNIKFLFISANYFLLYIKIKIKINN